MTTVNLGRVRPIHKGTYSGATAYTPLDIVTYGPLSYICVQPSAGNLPTDTDYFQPITDLNPDAADLILMSTGAGDFRWKSPEEARAALGPTATIKHVRSGTYVYDVITVSDPKAVKKYPGTGVASDGVVDRATLRETAKAQGFQIVTNCDGWKNADGSPGYEKTSARPRGLHIAAGVVYQDFLESETHDVAVTMSTSGILGSATADDGLTAEERVAAGIVWAATWGDFCVVSGSAVDLDSSILGTTVSAWTIIGQKADGTILLVAIEGVTGSYGATATQAGVIMESLGCQTAYILDGGGSSQIWWKNCYASHSSDNGAYYLDERAVPTFLYVDVQAPPPDYDTGPIEVPLASGFTSMSGGDYAAVLRQTGCRVDVTFRVSGTFGDGLGGIEISDLNAIPKRFLPSFDGPQRVIVAGNSGRVGCIYVSSDGRLRVSTISANAALTYVAGSGGWPAPSADKGRQDV